MKIRKCFLLAMSLVSINFLNLNASQKDAGEIKASESFVSSTKLNLVQKNDKKIFTIEVYQADGKLSSRSEYELKAKDKDFEENELGIVIIDEAGQATPFSAMGLLYRANRCIIVGDPLQVEPVMTVTSTLIRAISNKYELNKLEKEFNIAGKIFNYTSPSLSIQTLADYANLYYGKIGETEVGCPLVVHRRCLSPMFDISNRISYDNRMINKCMPDKVKVDYVLEKNEFIDIKGQEAGNGNHYVKEQSEKIIEIIKDCIENRGIKVFENSKLVLVHAEHEMIDKAIELNKNYGKGLYVCHIPSAEELKKVINTKKDGNLNTEKHPVYAEVTPHHLFLNTEIRESTERNKMLLRMKPELREKSDNEFLWEAINRGEVDTIGTDHAPHLIKEKLEKVTFGMPGVETSLALMINAYNKGKISLEMIQKLMCENPAKIMKILKRGKLQEGYFADIIVVDTKKEWIVGIDDTIESKCGWTPYENWKLKGKNTMTIVNGKIVYENGKIQENVKNGKEIEFYN